MAIAPLNQLAENIQGSIQGLLDDFRGRNSVEVPVNPSDKTISPVLSDINPGNWLKLSFPYTFGVVDIRGGGFGTLTDMPFTDFELPLAPQAINMTEEFATSIRPTQGGTVVNHSGNRYKTLNIKGTTGIHPFRGAGGVNKRTGEAIFQPKKLKYRSGYEVFLRFRNWLRAYYEFKKNNTEEAKHLRLVFKNFKDGEILLCVCQKFELSRQAAGSFLYDYDLQFRVIAPLQSFEIANRFTNLEDSLERANELLDSARGVFLRTQDILRQIEGVYNDVVIEPLRKINLIIKAALGVPTLAADIGERIIQNTLSILSTIAITLGIRDDQTNNRVTGDIDPRLVNISIPSDIEATVQLQGAKFINSFGEGLMAIPSNQFPASTLEVHEQEKNELLTTPRSFYEDTLANLVRIKQNAEDFFGLGDADFDERFDRTATLSADPSKIITVEELNVLGALNDAITGIQLILATTNLFKADFDERIAELIRAFEGRVTLQASSAVRQITVKREDSLEKLAQIYLGDSNRWGEIAELNFLNAPYIIDDPTLKSDGVLIPGDILLIPSNPVSGFSEAPQGKQLDSEKDVSVVLKSLGRDLKINEGFDLVLSSTGDFETVSEIDNLAQAVVLKLAYIPGEVMRYPELGAGIVIGSKFPPLDQLKTGVVNTLLADPRIENLIDLRLERQDSELLLAFSLKIKQVDQPVPISIPIL